MAYSVMLLAFLVAVASYLVELPMLIVLIALAAGALASVALSVIVFRAGRRTRHGFFRCLWEAMKLPLDFLFSLP